MSDRTTGRGRLEAALWSGATAASPRGMRSTATAALAALLVLGATACDDQVKYVETFATMTEQRAIQTYEQPPIPPVEGTVPVDGTAPGYTVQEADTALSSPLQPTASTIERGREVYRDYCLTCHGPEGEGDGPVINTSGDHPGRLPALPGADLTASRARGLSDGWIWGVITNGFSIMPSYERIAPRDRWHVVEYVRYLQQQAVSGEEGGGDATSTGSGESSAEASEEL